MRLRTLPLVLLALPLLVAGCDEVGSTLFPLPDEIGVNFEFEFEGSDVEGGQVVRLNAEDTRNILNEIRRQGFGPEAVVRVTLVPGSAQVRLRAQPPGANLDVGFLDDVSLRLIGGGASAEVASAEGVETPSSMASEAELDESGENIASIVVAGDFSATLDLNADADAEVPDGRYLVETPFDVLVEVEGL